MESVEDFETIDIELDELLTRKPTQRCQDSFLNTLCEEEVGNLEECIPEEEEDAVNNSVEEENHEDNSEEEEGIEAFRDDEEDTYGEAEEAKGIEFTTHDPKTKWNKMIPCQGEMYENPHQLKLSLTNYAVTKGYAIKFKKSDNVRVVAVCASEPKGDRAIGSTNIGGGFGVGHSDQRLGAHTVIGCYGSHRSTPLSKLMRTTQLPDAKVIKEGQLIIRARNLRAAAKFISPKAFRARKVYYRNEENGLLHIPKGEALRLRIHRHKCLSFEVVNQSDTRSWVNFFFSGFVAAKIPFPLTQRFRSMLQNGIDLSSVDVSYVAMDDTQRMMQMSGFGYNPYIFHI
ncbi:hypothetical protein LXL04_034756 [Taraxacum kok-saghyz]